MKPSRPQSFHLARVLALATVAAWALVGVVLIATGIATRSPALAAIGAGAGAAALAVLATRGA